MAELGGTRLGTMIAEIDLDARRYDAGLRAALQSAETTTQSAEQAWRRLGTGSTESIDRMRANVVRSYETIRQSGTHTAAEIERAEAAARARLEQINRRYFGSLNNQMRQAEAQAQRATSVFSQMFASFTLANIASQAMYKLGDAISKVYRDAFNSVENLKVSSASLAATITTLADKSSGKSIADIYKQAYDYSVILTQKLEEWDARTLATGENLRAMVETMAQAGVLLDVNNKKQEEGIIALANALAITTQGQNAQIQFRQEIRGLMDGEVKVINRLATMIDNVLGGSLESSINKWREQGTLIENIGSLLVGFNAATKDLESTWAAVGSTLETIYHKTLRGLFVPIYEDIINLGKEITLNVLEQDEKTQSFSETLNTGVYKVWETIKNVMSIVGNTLEAFKVPLGLVASLVGTILDGWGNIVAVLDVVLGRITSMVGSLWSASSGLANFGKMFYAYVSGGVEAGDAVLQQVKSNFAEAGSKAGKAFSGGLLNEISDNVVKYNKNVNAVVEKANVNPPKMATIVDHEEAEKNAKKAAKAAESAAKKAQSEANRAAKQAEAEAKRHAQEMLKIREQAETDYNKSMFAEIDNQKAKIEAEYQQREKAGYDSVKNERLRQRLIQDLETDRIKEFEKGFEAERDAYEKRVKEMKELEEQRVEEALKAMEEMQQAYEDFVYDVKSATSDMFMDLFEGGFSSMFDNLEAMFRRTLANLAAEAIAEPIIVPVIQSVAGGVGSTVANAMGIPSIAGQTGGFNLLGNANTLYSAVSGGMEAGVYNALTNGMLNNVGASIFGAGAWGGTAVSTGALAAGGELGWGAANMAALGTGTGAAGIAGTLAVAAPYLAAAAIAAPLIMKMLEDEPEPFLRVQTTSTSRELSNPDYKWADGEGKSLAGFDYNLTMQDIGGETQKELGAALKNMLDAQFTAIEDTLNVSVNEAIVEAQNAGTGYGDGFFSRVDLRDYEDNIAGALQALTDDLFLDIRDNLTNQLTDGKSSIFNADFFKGIAAEGETAVDTFLRFGKTLETNTSFMEDFTERTEELGQTAAQAYNAIVAIEQLGASITGLTSASVASALWESIKAGQSATDFVATLENQVREGVAQATVNAFAESLYSAFLQPINAAIGQMVTSMVSGGITTGAALTASMATIRESLNLALEVFKNEDFKTMITNFTTELTTAIGTTPAIYTPSITVNNAVEEKQTAAEKADETAADNAQKLLELMKSIKLSITDSGLSEYALAIETIKRAAEESITNVTALGASEEQLAEVRQLETIQIKKTIKEWADDLKEYTRSFSNMSDVLSSTMESLDKAIESYAKFAESAEEMGTEPALRMASINAALAPVKDSFMNLFDEVFALSKSDIEIETNAIVSQTKDLVDAIEFLSSQGVFALEGLDGFIDGIYDVGEKLVNAKKMSIYRDSLSSFGSTQAQIAGLSDEYNLMNLSNRYGTDFTDDKNRQEILNALTYMQYDDVLKWSAEVGISIETLLEDMITLSDISSELSDSFKEVQETLDDYRKSLLTSDYSYLDPAKKTEIARQNLMNLSQQSLSSDPAIAQKAMNAMPAAAEELLRLSKASNTSMLDYNLDMALVLQSLNKAESYAATYVDTTEDMTDEQDKALKELQRGHLQNISKTLNNLDKGMAAIFDDPELKKFFSDFSTIFGTGVMDSLTGNIDILDETIDEFKEKGILDLEELKALLITGLPLSESDRLLLENMEIAWDGDAAIDFWASVAMDFQGTFEEAMGLLGFVYNTSNQNWNAPAVVGFIQGYDEWYKIGNIKDIMATIGFIGDEAGWESPALVSFVGNTSLWSKVSFTEAMSALAFIYNSSGKKWDSSAVVSFIQAYGGWNNLNFTDKMAALHFLADTTAGGWSSKAVLAFISNTSAFGTLTVRKALTALKMTADGSGGWGTKATVSMIATMLDTSTLKWSDIITKMKENGAVDDTIEKTITAVTIQKFDDVSKLLSDAGITDKNLQAKFIAAVHSSFNSSAEVDALLAQYGISDKYFYSKFKAAVDYSSDSDAKVKQLLAQYGISDKYFYSKFKAAVDYSSDSDAKVQQLLAQYGISDKFFLANFKAAVDSVSNSNAKVQQLLAQYGISDKFFLANFKAAVDSSTNSDAEIDALLKAAGITNKEFKQTLIAELSSTSDLTVTQLTNILNAWGDKEDLTANVTGNITNTVNIASNTLLTETTFNDFAKAFLTLSTTSWTATNKPSTIIFDKGTPEQTYGYSIVDAIWYLSTVITGMSTTGTGSSTGAITSSGSVYASTSTGEISATTSWGAINVSGTSVNFTFPSGMSSLPVSSTILNWKGISGSEAMNWAVFTSGLNSGLKAISQNLSDIKNPKATSTTVWAGALAQGGYHSGGLRLVGELGPELEMTGPSRIMSNSDTKDLFGSAFGGQNAVIVKELRKLREDIDRLNKINFQQLKAVTRQKKIFDKWDIDGTPPEREAVAA